MKKSLLIALSLLSLAGTLYAGSGCCSSKKKSADKTEKVEEKTEDVADKK